MICPNCKEEFTPRTVVQIYCSRRCGYQYRAKHEVNNWPSISFNCAKCGRLVVTDGKRDMRTRFCSQSCEKNYWRHPPHEHEASRQNFHSLQEYESWERRTNA